MGSGDYNLKLNSKGGGKGKQGVHVCPRCRWPFPNPQPSQKKRASHKKQCGLIQGYPVSCPNGEISVDSEMRDVEQKLNGKGNNLESSDRNKEIEDLHTCDTGYEIENQRKQAVSETNCSEMTEVEQKLGENDMCILEKSCERKGTRGSEKLKDETDIKDHRNFGAVNMQTPLPGKSVNPSETLTNNEQADKNEKTSNELRTHLQSENVPADPGSVESAACTVRKKTKLIQDQEASSHCSVSSSDQLPKGYCDLPFDAGKQDMSECFVLESARMYVSVDEGNVEKTIDGKSLNLKEEGHITCAHGQNVIEDIHGTQDPRSSQREFESNQEERGEEIEFDSGDTAMVVVNGNINNVDAVFCQEDGKKHHAAPVHANSRFSDDTELSSMYCKDTGNVSKDMEQNPGNLKGNHFKRNTSEVIIEAFHEKSVECSVDSNTMNSQSEVAIHNDNKGEICACKQHFVDIDSENGKLDRLICYSSQLQINGGLYSVGTRHVSDTHHGISSDFHKTIAPTIISQQPSKDDASPIENDGINSLVGDPTENHRGSSHGESSSTKDLNNINAANSGILRKLQQSNSNYEDIKISCSRAGTESRRRKEQQEVKHRATDWTSVKHEIQVERVKIRTSLRDLLMEPNYDTKQGTQYTTRRYISSPLNRPHAMQDEFREHRRGESRKEDPSSQSAVTLMMHKEWNSPARFPVGRTSGRKTKEQWTPFMCC